MIEQLTETRTPAFGFRVEGQLTSADVATLTTRLDAFLRTQKHPIGLLADLSDMHGATWSGRWDEMRFLQRHSDHIARFAVLSNEPWEQLRETVITATATMQAQTRYFQPGEILHAWHWVRMKNTDDGIPVRIMYPGHGLFQDYTPEFVGI